MATKFSTRHYVAIAKALKDQRENYVEVLSSGDIRNSQVERDYKAYLKAVMDLEDRLCGMFRNDNPEFRADKFVAASGRYDE